MRYQIRNSCFESNSSSMHSLIMIKNKANERMTMQEIRDEFYLDEEWHRGGNVLELDKYNNSFGRSPFDVLTTFSDKLKYAIAEFCGGCYTIDSYLKAEKLFDEVFRPLILKLVGVDDINTKWMYTMKNFYIYSDTENIEDLDKVEEVPYDKRVHKEDWKRGEPWYEDHDVDGRPIEEAWFDVPSFGGIDHQSNGVLKCFLEKTGMGLEDYLVRKDVVVIIDGDEYYIFGNMIDCGLVDKNNIVDYRRYADYEDTDED